MPRVLGESGRNRIQEGGQNVSEASYFSIKVTSVLCILIQNVSTFTLMGSSLPPSPQISLGQNEPFMFSQFGVLHCTRLRTGNQEALWGNHSKSRCELEKQLGCSLGACIEQVPCPWLHRPENAPIRCPNGVELGNRKAWNKQILWLKTGYSTWRKNN